MTEAGEQRPVVAFIHTVPFLVDEFRARMAEAMPTVPAFHVLDESLLRDLIAGAPVERVYPRVVAQVLLACEAGADLVVVTCSSTSPAVDIARRLTTIPIIKIDDPLADAAVRAGGRIGVVCTASSTVDTSTALIRSHASGAEPEISVRLVEAAYLALRAGDRRRHDDLVREAAIRLAREVEVVVLAQASLAHLGPSIAEATGTKVLASPDLLMLELRGRIESASEWSGSAGGRLLG